MAQFDTSFYGTKPRSVAEYDAIADEAEARKLGAQANRLGLMLQQRQVRDAQRAEDDQNRLRTLLQAAPANATDEDRIRLLRGAGFHGPADALVDASLKRRKTEAEIGDTQASAAEKAARTDKERIARGLQQFEIIGQIMGGVRDQATYDAARQRAAEVFGPEFAAKIPAAYDPAAVARNQQQAMSVKDRLEQEWKAKGYDLDVRKQGEVERNNAVQNRIAQGNLGVAQGNLGVARERLTLDKNQPKGTYDPALGVVVDPRTATATPVTMGGQPLAPKKPTEQQARVNDANEAIALLNQADELISKSTGSYAGAALDMIPQVIGKSTEGARAAAQLKALEGMLVAKMPKMSGPQSDKDVALYRQMAANIGDPTIPNDQKAAALETVREIQERYAGIPRGSSRPRGATGDFDKPAVPKKNITVDY